MVGYVGLVLHAHLPYVRHPEHARSFEERWLYEALWEAYLPLCDVLDRLAAEGVRAPFTLSVSPPLASMLRDPLLLARFDGHLERLERLSTGARRFVPATLAAVLDFYRRRLTRVRATWDRIGGDVLAELARHARAGRIELWTSAVTHAYLPGLLGSPRSLRAQVRLGLASFEALVGLPASGFWLPECAYDAALEADVAAAGVKVTVLDAHGLELARPRPRAGAQRPVLSRSGIACFARDPEASEDVWSRRSGYPGDPVYRDFYRDLGFDLPDEALADEIGPGGTRVMTGLKLHRITGPGDAKAAYEPEVASRRARQHAEDFVARRSRALAIAAEAGTDSPIIVAPFDEELFGHWWFEGPEFLEHALRGLAAAADRDDIAPTGLAAHAEAQQALEVVEPATSTWGDGGFGAAWTGPACAHLARHARHVERAVLAVLATPVAAAAAETFAGRALDQAIVELLLLQASDFAFMLWRNEMGDYARERVRAHASRAARLASIAAAPPDAAGRAFLEAVEQRDPFLRELRGARLRRAFDA